MITLIDNHIAATTWDIRHFLNKQVLYIEWLIDMLCLNIVCDCYGTTMTVECLNWDGVRWIYSTIIKYLNTEYRD